MYQNNLSALGYQNLQLKQELLKIAGNTRYEVLQTDSYENINLFDKVSNVWMYAQPMEETAAQLQRCVTEKQSPYLYMYGIGNAVLVQKLASESFLERVVVIEPSLELLYIAFNLFDFSAMMQSKKMQFLHPSQLSIETVVPLLEYKQAKKFLKLIELIPNTPYYETLYAQEKMQSEHGLAYGVQFLMAHLGNSCLDSLKGFEHHLLNSRTMLEALPLHEVLNKKNSNLALIVATGPSLAKQLPLLKKIQDHITIFSLDASLPILEKNGIQADICLSIERGEATIQFFKETSVAYQNEVIFVCASVQHPKLLEAIHGKRIVSMRPFEWCKYFGFDRYGYIGTGLSVTNMAQELIFHMGYTHCVFIGQDLAFGPDMASHTLGYSRGERDKGPEEYARDILAYGGNGMVKTREVWYRMLQKIEQVILETSQRMQTINATEGGARIQGSIEMSFQDVAKKLVHSSSIKKQIVMKPVPKEIVKKNMAHFEQKLSTLQVALMKIVETAKTMRSICEESVQDKKALDVQVETLETLRSTLETVQEYKSVVYNLLQQVVLRVEMELNYIKYREGAWKSKWIKAHKAMIDELIAGSEAMLSYIDKVT